MEGHIFHNRLTHSLEVAQIARRLAERLAQGHPRLALRAGGIDADVVEAAALAHDLGHPPFGHVAEAALDELAKRAGDPDGFEGNAQSFRIVVRLAAHRESYRGLNLCRATLNALLKYPWVRDLRDRKGARYRKYGAYRSDQMALRFARQGAQVGRKSIEAEIMDHADNVAYSVHDFDDFLRAGLISVEHLKRDDTSLERFLGRWAKSGKVSMAEAERYRSDFKEFLKLIVDSQEPYRGTFRERAARRTVTSGLISDYILSVTLTPRGLVLPEQRRMELAFLQRVVWEQVITAPSLATQQAGQRAIIQRLFETYLDAAKRRYEDVLPAAYHEDLSELGRASKRRKRATVPEIRLAVDVVASLTDQQAYALHARLSGNFAGSVVDLAAR